MLVARRVVYRFAEFEVDPGARTVSHRAAAIVISGRTFDLLLFLVQHSGQVLSKEELLKNVWPDAYVDENSLAKNISILRKALEEAAPESRLVVTLPGRGYQFAAPVEIMGEAAASLETMQDAGNPQVGVVIQKRTLTTTVTEERGGALRFSPMLWLGLAGFIALAVAGYLAWRHWHPAPQSASIVLGDFENSTGDKDFDDALNQALQIDLEQSPFLQLVPRLTIQETLQQMQRRKDDRLVPALAVEICERNNAQAVLHGSIARLADKYLLILNASSCVSGKTVAAYKAQVGSKGDVLAALDTAANRVRKQLGESAASLENFRIPIAQATTSSLDALRAYTQALDASDRGDTAAEQALFRRAVELDPNFASAYKDLGMSLHDRQDYAQGAATIKQAYDLRGHTTQRERLEIEIAYNIYGTNDLEATAATMRLFNQIYPNDAANWTNLARVYTQLGQTQQAIEAAEYAYRLSPHSGLTEQVLANCYKRANRFADARRIADAAIAEGKDRWGMHSILFQIAYLEHDAARMKTEGEWGFTHGEMGQSLTELGFVAASTGKLREAIADFTRAREEGIRSGDPDFADQSTMFLAGILIEYGEPKAAAESLNEMRSDANDPGTTAYFRANLGDLAAAQRQIDKLSTSDLQNTLSTYFDLPQLRAFLALKAHKPAEAIADLEPARKYQMRDYGVPYQRARAEADAGMYPQAEDDYRLILDNPGLEPIWPALSLAQLRLAQVLALDNRPADARHEYETFFKLWKDGDPDVPLLVQAKAEYAKLKVH